MKPTEWDEFVQQHGDIVGYTTDPIPGAGTFLPVPPGAGPDDPLVHTARQLGLDVYAVYGVNPTSHYPQRNPG